jgi:hypothetical protein
MTDMTYRFKCWMPTFGQSIKDAVIMLREGPAEAAADFAKQFLEQDTGNERFNIEHGFDVMVWSPITCRSSRFNVKVEKVLEFKASKVEEELPNTLKSLI